MSEIRRIRRDNIGTILKQGDTAEVHFSLYDAENGNDTGILNQPAEVVFLQDETVVYTTRAQVDDMYMCRFHVEAVLPAGLYHVEFIVNGGIYPSGDKPYFTITKSSRGADANIIQAYGFDDVVKRVVSEVAHTNLVTKEELAQVQKEHNEVTAQLAQKAEQEEVNTVSGRIDNLVAHAGNTDGNAELLDIRVGWDGVAYPTAGDAVRSIQQVIGELQTANRGVIVISSEQTKPIVEKGEALLEYDTGKVFFYDGTDWIEDIFFYDGTEWRELL